MPLTSQQKAALKAHINASPDLNTLPNSPDGNFEIARLLNLQNSPNFTVWKTGVSVVDVGRAFNGTEWAGMTSTNHTRLQTVAMYCSTVNPSDADIRAMFDDIWSGAGGAQTRTALLALWKRLVTRCEKVLADTAGGNGADATPALLTFEGQITWPDVAEARNS